MLTRYYICDNCRSKQTEETSACQRCGLDAKIPTLRGEHLGSPGVRKRLAGQIYKGLRLESKQDHSWIVTCLWCKSEPFLIRYSNIGLQNSCGCVRNNFLSPNYYDDDAGIVNCTCRECGLTKDYDLNEPGQILCASGCQLPPGYSD